MNLSWIVKSSTPSNSYSYLCLLDCCQTVLHLHGLNHTDLLTLCNLNASTKNPCVGSQQYLVLWKTVTDVSPGAFGSDLPCPLV